MYVSAFCLVILSMPHSNPVAILSPYVCNWLTPAVQKSLNCYSLMRRCLSIAPAA